MNNSRPYILVGNPGVLPIGLVGHEREGEYLFIDGCDICYTLLHREHALVSNMLSRFFRYLM